MGNKKTTKNDFSTIGCFFWLLYDILIMEVCMEINELLNIYNTYNTKIQELWRLL